MFFKVFKEFSVSSRQKQFGTQYGNKRFKVQILLPGELFGDEELLASLSHRSSTLQCQTSTGVLRAIKMGDFRDILSHSKPLKEYLTQRHQSNRLNFQIKYEQMSAQFEKYKDFIFQKRSKSQTMPKCCLREIQSKTIHKFLQSSYNSEFIIKNEKFHQPACPLIRHSGSGQQSSGQHSSGQHSSSQSALRKSQEEGSTPRNETALAEVNQQRVIEEQKKRLMLPSMLQSKFARTSSLSKKSGLNSSCAAGASGKSMKLYQQIKENEQYSQLVDTKFFIIQNYQSEKLSQLNSFSQQSDRVLNNYLSKMRKSKCKDSAQSEAQNRSLNGFSINSIQPANKSRFY